MKHIKGHTDIYYPVAALTVGYLLYKRIMKVWQERVTLQPKYEDIDESAKNHCKYITLTGGNKTFYRIFNEHNFQKMPVLILVHGFVGSSRYFLPLINEIKKDGRPCIALDLYGRGRSDCPDIDYNPKNIRKQIEEFVIMLNIPTPFDILGYSMGGAVIAEFTATNSDLVRSA